MEPYTLLRTLRGFDDSINCLQFSTEGQLAAGGDDGRLAIFNILDEESEVISLVAAAPVTSLLWHPVELNSIFVGYSNGAIFLYHIATQEMDPSGSRIDTESQAPVEALDCDATGDTLAAIVGSEVILCKLKRKGLGSYRLRKFPEPAFSTDLAAFQEISPCSLHFIEDGRAIIVSYLYHGLVCWDTETTQVKWILPAKTRITRATLSPDSKSIAVCNLCNGFDRYRIDHRKLVRNYPIPGTLNVSLPASFIHNGDALLFGSACGVVTIVDKDDGSIVQTLDHTGDLIQAAAYVVVRGELHIIATGSSERGQDTQIKVWRSGNMVPLGRISPEPNRPEEQPDIQLQVASTHGGRGFKQPPVLHRADSFHSSGRYSHVFYRAWVGGAAVLVISLDLSGWLVPLLRKLDLPHFNTAEAVGDSVVKSGLSFLVRELTARFPELVVYLKDVMEKTGTPLL